MTDMGRHFAESNTSEASTDSPLGVTIVSLVLVDTSLKICIIDSASLDSVAEVVMVSVNVDPVQNVWYVAPGLAQLLLQLLKVAVDNQVLELVC